jgi:hypothetical protein
MAVTPGHGLTHGKCGTMTSIDSAMTHNLLPHSEWQA